MIAKPNAWLRESISVYRNNATAVRDYRAQLRGSRPLIWWAGYLVLLILLAGTAYSNALNSSMQSLSSIQAQLRNFYEMVMGFLAVVVVVATPALTATSVASERVRRSLDLVACAPISNEYFLIGKMISSFRYTWMLLILALPVTAVCVVMGGATWIDVLAAFVILASCALVCTAIGLVMSVVAATPIAAVLYTYLGVLIYTLIATSVAYSTQYLGYSSMARPGTVDANWTMTLTPFLASQAAPTFSRAFGIDIPNVLIGFVYSLLVTKLLIVGAASGMSRFGARETKTLRTLVFVTFAALGFLAARIAIASKSVGAASQVEHVVVPMLTWTTVFVCLFMPILACFAPHADRKFRNDGAFRLGRIFVGTPAGALPYAFLIVIGAFGALGLTAWPSLGLEFWGALLWTCSYVLFWWAMSRLVSTFATSLRAARMGVFGAMLVLVGLPLPVVGVISSMSPGWGFEELKPLLLVYPLTFRADNSIILIHGLVLLAAGSFVAYVALGRERQGELAPQVAG